eukprot:14879771-Alexandrium_andersonii.AAC.1
MILFPGGGAPPLQTSPNSAIPFNSRANKVVEGCILRRFSRRCRICRRNRPAGALEAFLAD